VKPVIFRPAAAADVEDAYRWYEAQQAGLGEEFLAAVRIIIESITANPKYFLSFIVRPVARSYVVFHTDFTTALLTIRLLS